MTAVDPYGLVGQVLDGQFRVDAPIGEGGFSIVYRGRHLGLDEPVAIKCLKLQGQMNTALVDAFVQRFRDESKIQYKLSQGSLYITRTIAAGTTMAPATMALVPYMVLEWLEGYTLSAELRARRMRGERGRTIAQMIRLLDPVAEAMAVAHSMGVVHRDLNPSNVFVAAQHGGGFKLKVMDFGVAKVVSDHALSFGKRAPTLGQFRLFTPAYGAPEQFSERYGAIGPWTDVYAFALMITEVLTDRAPVDADDFGELLRVVIDPNIRPSPRALGAAVGDRFERAVMQALHVDPSLRPTDIGVFWGALKHAQQQDEAGHSIPAPLPMPPLSLAQPNPSQIPSVHPGMIWSAQPDSAASGQEYQPVPVQPFAPRPSSSVPPPRAESSDGGLEPVPQTVRMPLRTPDPSPHRISVPAPSAAEPSAPPRKTNRGTHIMYNVGNAPTERRPEIQDAPSSLGVHAGLIPPAPKLPEVPPPPWGASAGSDVANAGHFIVDEATKLSPGADSLRRASQQNENQNPAQIPAYNAVAPGAVGVLQAQSSQPAAGVANANPPGSLGPQQEDPIVVPKNGSFFRGWMLAVALVLLLVTAVVLVVLYAL